MLQSFYIFDIFNINQFFYNIYIDDIFVYISLQYMNNTKSINVTNVFFSSKFT